MIAQLARFGVVGVAAMITHWSVVAIVVPFGIPPLVANVIAFCVAFNVSFFGHHHWTFASAESRQNTFKRFLSVAVLGFVTNESLYALLLEFSGLDYRIALVIVLASVAILTFLLSRFWAFRHR